METIYIVPDARSPLISNFNNLYGYGVYGLYWANMEFVQNIYCGGGLACSRSTISNVYNTVYGNNYQSLYRGVISNVVNNVIGMGYESMFYSTIYNVTNVYCISTRSCAYSQISAIHNKLEANGNNSLSGSVIISQTNFEENGTLYIFINGSNYEKFDIYCSETDICIITCESTDSCTQLYVYCGSLSMSRCFVYCDETEGINCPYYGNYTQLTFATTTTIPTTTITSEIASTTTITSRFPSGMPNDMPTTVNVSTNVPTEIPNTESTSIATTEILSTIDSIETSTPANVSMTFSTNIYNPTDSDDDTTDGTEKHLCFFNTATFMVILSFFASF